MKSPFFKSIVWAVDAFEEAEFHKGVLATLGALTRATGATVEPVHILVPPYTSVNPLNVKAGVPSNFEQAFRSLAEKRLFEFARTGDIPTMTAGKVLEHHSASTKSAVQALIDLAEKQESDAIIVATHARRGVSRFFLGSFAETLLLKSTVPIITVNPETKVRERVRKILLPTTFGRQFRGAFTRAAQLAKILDAELTVFFKEPELPSVYMSPLVSEFIEKETFEREAHAKEWQEWASKSHLPVKILIDRTPGAVTYAITDYAKANDFDLIVMATQADAGSIPIVGSVSREVVRSAPCPVWVMRAEDQDE